MTKKLIDDGYEITGTVPAIGPWPEVVITYRPALRAKVAKYFADKDREAAGDKMVLEHLRSWDVTDGDGKPAPITRETLARVPHPVFMRMLDMITSYAGEQAADEKN